MKRPTDLFDLIKSLTPAEKGYFKKYVAKGDGKKYLKLFDTINAMEEYDEEKLRKKMGKEVSNLSAAKGYLYDAILENLIQLKLQNDDDFKGYSSLFKSVVLRQKNLVMQAKELAEETQKEAQVNQWFELALLLHYEKLCYVFEKGNVEDVIHFIEHESPTTQYFARQISVRARLHYYMGLLHLFGITKGVTLNFEDSEKLRAEMGNFFETYDPSADSPRLRHVFHNAAGNYSRKTGNIKKVVEHQEKEYLAKCDVGTSTNSQLESIISALYNLVTINLNYWQVHRSWEWINKMRELLKEKQHVLSAYNKTRAQGYLPTASLFCYYKQGKHREALDYYRQQQNWFKKNFSSLTWTIQTDVRMCVILLYYSVEDYRACIAAIQDFVYHSPKAENHRNKVTALIIQLAIYYDTKDVFLLKQNIASIYRSILKWQYNTPAMKNFIDFLKTSVRAGVLDISKDVWVNLLESMKEANTKTRVTSFGFFSVNSWILSRINRTSMHEEFMKEARAKHQLYCERLNLESVM